MTPMFSVRPMIWVLAIVAFTLALPAHAVRLSSTGANNEYVGVANYAFSYSSVPYTLTASCTNGSARDSAWKVIPASCDTTTDSSCWADTCEGCNFADAYISLSSMRKGLLNYYARDHKDGDQGVCTFEIGTSSFSINFNYQDTGVDFSLSLVPGTSTGEAGWITSGSCPPASPPASADVLPQSFSANVDPESQYNLICNEDFLVSLAADPSISNGAMISVVNNVNALSTGAQELPSAVEMTATRASSGALSSQEEGARTLSNRTTDSGRWLVTSDAAGREVRGALISGASLDTTELAACHLAGDDGSLDPVDRHYLYDCVLASLDGTSTRNEAITLPGSLLRVRPLKGPVPPVLATDVDVVSYVNIAISEFAKSARVSSTDTSQNIVWHGQGGQSRVVMVKRGSEDQIEVVTHSAKALSPIFMACAASQGGDELNPEYLCKANLRCTGSPCADSSWSVNSKLKLPAALFKNRPCQPDNGVLSMKPFLKVESPGLKGRRDLLKFHSKIVFPAGSVIRPDKTGFRLLVEDARGYTVVDVDVPGNHYAASDRTQSLQPQKPRRDLWQVGRGGKMFTYRSSKPIGGVVPSITMKLTRPRGNEWLVTVTGSRGRLNAQDLLLPLDASLTLNPADQNSGLCSATDFASPTESGNTVGTCSEQPMGPDKGGARIICR